jgi:hypothetical protein
VSQVRSHSIQQRREQTIGEPRRKTRRKRHPRLFATELPAGAPLPRQAEFWLPNGVYTRNRQLVLALRTLQAQGITPWRSRTHQVAEQYGPVPMVVVEVDGEPVPIYFTVSL